MTADFFGPHDSHDESPPQGQKYLETRIRQTHYRDTNCPRNISFLSLKVENDPPDELQLKFNDYSCLKRIFKILRMYFYFPLVCFCFENATKGIIKSYKFWITTYVRTCVRALLFQIVIVILLQEMQQIAKWMVNCFADYFLKRLLIDRDDRPWKSCRVNLKRDPHRKGSKEWVRKFTGSRTYIRAVITWRCVVQPKDIYFLSAHAQISRRPKKPHTSAFYIGCQ
mgnify:CR=1 FL=1